MSLPAYDIPLRFWFVLVVEFGGFGLMFWHALHRQRP